jgi:hypothetical protein
MDQMLAEQQQVTVESDIEMDAPQMDVGGVQLTDDDAILSQVFASSQEVQNALTAAAHQGLPVSAGFSPTAGMTRTASTRTVGTRPTAGVSQLGGAGAPASASDENSKLSSLWSSAPDVSNTFR